MKKIDSEHQRLWDIMKSAERKYQDICVSFDSHYEALDGMDDVNSAEFNEAVNKLVKEEEEAGKPEAYKAYENSYNAMLDHAGKFLESQYPGKWKEVSFLFESKNRIIYRHRILKIFEGLIK